MIAHLADVLDVLQAVDAGGLCRGFNLLSTVVAAESVVMLAHNEIPTIK